MKMGSFFTVSLLLCMASLIVALNPNCMEVLKTENVEKAKINECLDLLRKTLSVLDANQSSYQELQELVKGLKAKKYELIAKGNENIKTSDNKLQESVEVSNVDDIVVDENENPEKPKADNSAAGGVSLHFTVLTTAN